MNIFISLRPDEYQVFHEGFKKSVYPKRTDYARKLLLGKPVVTIFRNRSLDDLIEMGSGLRKELRRFLACRLLSPAEQEELHSRIISIEDKLIKVVDLCKQVSEGVKTSE